MAKHYSAIRVKETRYVLNGSTGEVDAKLYTTTYDGKAYGSNNRRGGFVYSIFILVCVFLVFLGVYGVSTKDNPMDLIVETGNIIADYGDVSGSSIKTVVETFEKIKISQSKIDDILDDDDDNIINSTFLDKFINRDNILNAFVSVYNKFISIVSFLVVVPYVIGTFALNLIITFVRIVYLFVS